MNSKVILDPRALLITLVVSMLAVVPWRDYEWLAALQIWGLLSFTGLAIGGLVVALERLTGSEDALDK